MSYNQGYPPNNPYSNNQEYQDSNNPFASNASFDNHYSNNNNYNDPGRPQYASINNDYAKNDYSEPRKGGGAKKWIIIAVIIVVLLIAGVVVGVIMSKRKSGDSSSSESKASFKALNGTSGVVKSDPNDPSKFEKNSKLTKSFWGMTYIPWGADDENNCYATINNVTQDMQLLSQLTTRLRLYGSACEQGDITLTAIENTKTDVKLWLGAYVSLTNLTTTQRQLQFVYDTISKHGIDHVGGVVVGNEVILNAADPSYSGNYDQAAMDRAIDFLIEYMNYARGNLSAMGHSLPVGTGDAGSALNAKIANAADFILPNIHAFIGGVPVDVAAGWTWEYFQTNDANLVSGSKEAIIGELGWPTDSMTTAAATVGGAVAGVAQSQQYLNDYVCAANTNGTKYFYFEPFDEPWKAQFGGVEPYWGLADSNRNWKDITFPNCPL